MIHRLMSFMIAVMILAACSGPGARVKPRNEKPVEKSDLTESAFRWADSVCSVLTIRQKIAQMFMPAIYSSADAWTLRLVRQYRDSCIGGVVLLRGDSVGVSKLSAELNELSGVPPFVSIDAEWGLAMRLADAPEFPMNHDIAEDVDDRLMYDYGRELARECRLLGINMVLGPVLDVSPVGGIMHRRSLGEDPVRVADLSVAYARGLEDGNVISVAKHFPGHGSVGEDSHKRKGVIHRSLHQMDSVDLYPFRRWIEQRLSGVMVGHLAVPSIDSEMRPAAVSPVVIRDLLRRDMQFSGLVLTDALNMEGAEGYSSVDAISAGADIVLAPHRTFDEIDKVAKAVGDGILSESDIDSHVRRILFYKYLLFVEESDDSDPGGEADTATLRTVYADSIASRLAD